MTWGYIVVSIGLLGLLVELWLDYAKQAAALDLDLQSARLEIEQHLQANEEAQEQTEKAKRQLDQHKDHRVQLQYELGEFRQQIEELQRRRDKRIKRLERHNRMQQEL
jgi:flagellar motor switch/type III secretory pathway protein FliN